MRRTTRDQQHIVTELAPEAFNTRAQASAVAPVVKTSSTTITARPAMCALRFSRAAPFTVRLRSFRSRPRSSGVARRRSIRSGDRVSPVSRASARAISNA